MFKTESSSGNHISDVHGKNANSCSYSTLALFLLSNASSFDLKLKNENHQDHSVIIERIHFTFTF